MPFNSLWLAFDRPQWPPLRESINAQITIIGGGISGIATLFFLLTRTDKTIVLLEKDYVASCATGHNAGLAFAAMEKPIKELISTFGIEKTRHGFYEIDHGWELLIKIIKIINAQDNFCAHH
jgi:L-2-hydroxyglutarate oxidase LhgO